MFNSGQFDDADEQDTTNTNKTTRTAAANAALLPPPTLHPPVQTNRTATTTPGPLHFPSERLSPVWGATDDRQVSATAVRNSALPARSVVYTKNNKNNTTTRNPKLQKKPPPTTTNNQREVTMSRKQKRASNRKRPPTQNPPTPSPQRATHTTLPEETLDVWFGRRGLVYEGAILRWDQPVECATRWITEELQRGPWSATPQDVQHMQLVATTLQDFSHNILSPSLDNKSRLNLSQPPSQLPRSFWAALLALREVLIQNASTIFRIDEIQTNTAQEVVLQKSMATGIVLAALARGGEAAQASWNVQNVQDHFLQLVEAYDGGSDEFTLAWERTHQQVVGPLEEDACPQVNSKDLHPHEQVAQNVSLQWALQDHPLARRRGVTHPSLVPSPNVCHTTTTAVISNTSG